jgi:hypothetical protein
MFGDIVMIRLDRVGILKFPAPLLLGLDGERDAFFGGPTSSPSASASAARVSLTLRSWALRASIDMVALPRVPILLQDAHVE